MRTKIRIRPLCLCLLPLLSGAGTEQSAGGTARVFDGYIEASTPAGGLRTFVTVAPAPGLPLYAAFSVQHRSPALGAAYRGMGRVTLGETSLAVAGADGALLFKFPSQDSPLPAGTRAFDVIGIAAHSWPVGGPYAPPSSHEEFIAIQGWRHEEDPPPCNYKECVCGGRGAQSCSCLGHQVSCYSPYEACCTAASAFCCKPGEEGEGKKIRPPR